MKKLTIVALFTLCLSGKAQHPVDPYLEIAAGNSPELKARFSEFMASLEMIPQARGLADPNLMFGYFIQPIETRLGAQQATLGISQTFPWFGTLKAKESVACQLAEAKLTAFQDAKLELYRDIRVAYGELYYLKRAVELTEGNLQLLESFKELARVNFESGKTGFVNVLRVQMEEEELKANLDFLRDNQKSAIAAFRNLINMTPDVEIKIPDSLALVKLEYLEQALADSMIENNLQIRELQFETQAKEQQVEVARMMSKPTFTVGLNYTIIGERSGIDLPDNGKDALLLPQLGMSIPLFQKKYRALENRSIMEKEQLQYDLESKMSSLSSDLEYLIRDHIDGNRRMTLFRQLNLLAERSLSLLQTEFSTGKTDFEEVLRMERKMLAYQLEIERARVDINNAVYKINYLVGNEKFKN